MPKKPKAVVDPSSVLFFGETFRMAEKIGAMSVMRFAKIAAAGADSSDMDGLAAMYDLIKACIHRDDWSRFERVADDNSASEDELFEVVGQVLGAQADRPTERPSDSSDGPSAIAPSSTSTPADRAIAREAGRPELQLAIAKAQEHMQKTG